jgi:hypothetical protein
MTTKGFKMFENSIRKNLGKECENEKTVIQNHSYQFNEATERGFAP